MNKIIIFGNSGSGKSTLAKEYAAKYALSHLDLDTLAWENTHPPTRKKLKASSFIISQFISNNPKWVIEGGYTDLLSLITPIAQEIIFLNPGVEICINNCKNRPWEPHKYESFAKQNENLDMLLSWVKDYYMRDDDFSLSSHQKLFNDFHSQKTEYISNERKSIS